MAEVKTHLYIYDIIIKTIPGFHLKKKKNLYLHLSQLFYNLVYQYQKLILQLTMILKRKHYRYLRFLFIKLQDDVHINYQSINYYFLMQAYLNSIIHILFNFLILDNSNDHQIQIHLMLVFPYQTMLNFFQFLFFQYQF